MLPAMRNLPSMTIFNRKRWAHVAEVVAEAIRADVKVLCADGIPLNRELALHLARVAWPATGHA